MAFTLRSPAFADGQPIPAEHTREGDNLSPPLEFDGLPDGTAQLALIMNDPDAVGREPFTHWVIFAIPASLAGLPAGVPRDPQLDELGGAGQGVNSFGQIGYDGPQPPIGTGAHHYQFELFALDRPMQVNPRVEHKVLRASMAGAIIARASLTGLYQALADRAA